MASQFDESDFVDADLHLAHKATAQTTPVFNPSPIAGRPPTREELDLKVTEAQQRLAELRRAQEELERERSALEEARRRRVEWQTGREEMIHSLTRGIELLQEKEFAARRDAEQMAKSLDGLRDVLAKVTAIHEETWTQENWNTELTRALTSVENGRMEWNSARLKWNFLDGLPSDPAESAQKKSGPGSSLADQSFGRLCLTGLALTWPVLIGIIIAIGVFALRLWH